MLYMGLGDIIIKKLFDTIGYVTHIYSALLGYVALSPLEGLQTLRGMYEYYLQNVPYLPQI